MTTCFGDSFGEGCQCCGCVWCCKCRPKRTPPIFAATLLLITGAVAFGVIILFGGINSHGFYSIPAACIVVAMLLFCYGFAVTKEPRVSQSRHFGDRTAHGHVWNQTEIPERGSDLELARRAPSTTSQQVAVPPPLSVSYHGPRSAAAAVELPRSSEAEPDRVPTYEEGLVLVRQRQRRSGNDAEAAPSYEEGLVLASQGQRRSGNVAEAAPSYEEGLVLANHGRRPSGTDAEAAPSYEEGLRIAAATQ